jgi:hypothetical protein
MARAAETVKEAIAKKPGAVVDPAVVEPAAKLSAITYQKGAWVLHMLRRKLGDEPFFRALRHYYSAHAGGTATTEDLRQSLEAASGQDLAAFFRQWLHRPGLPELSVAWGWDEAARQVVVDVAQVQAGEPYDLDLDFAFRIGDGVERRTVAVRRAKELLRVDATAPPSALELDPDGWLLHTATVVPAGPAGTLRPRSPAGARGGLIRRAHGLRRARGGGGAARRAAGRPASGEASEGEQDSPLAPPPAPPAIELAKVENSFSTSACPHSGQATPSELWPTLRSSSNRLPQVAQRYSYSGTDGPPAPRPGASLTVRASFARKDSPGKRPVPRLYGTSGSNRLPLARRSRTSPWLPP